MKRKAPRFRILKKCMTRLEARRFIRNGTTHPAMMHDRRERAQNGVSLLHIESLSRLRVRFTSGKNLFQDFLPYVELYLYYLIVDCKGKPSLVDLDMFHGVKSLLI